MNELFKDLVNKPFKVNDIVYVYSGFFERSFGIVTRSDVFVTAIMVKGVEKNIATPRIMHYTRGQVIYPDQFTPCVWDKETFNFNLGS